MHAVREGSGALVIACDVAFEHATVGRKQKLLRVRIGAGAGKYDACCLSSAGDLYRQLDVGSLALTASLCSEHALRHVRELA